MEGLFWLLLPVAAASGWLSARYTARRNGGGAEPDCDRPERINRHCIQGLNYLLSEQSDKAIQHFVELVDVDEDTAETHLVLGSLFRRRGEVDRAIRIHQNIIARPNLSAQQKANALLQLGIDYFKAGLFDRAENIFHQLVASGAHSDKVYRYLRDLYEREKEWEQAIAMAERYGKASGESQATRIAHYWCELVEQSVRRRRINEAQERLRRALQTDPDCVRAYIQRGDIQVALGNAKEAIKSFRQALEKDRHFSPVVLKRLYDLFRRNDQLDRFDAWLRRNTDYHKDAAARFFMLKTADGLHDEAQVAELLHDELGREEPSLYIVRAYMEKMRDTTEGDIREAFAMLIRVLDARLSSSMACHCTRCGFESNTLFWQCPSCQNWGTVRPYQNPLEYAWLEG